MSPHLELSSACPICERAAPGAPERCAHCGSEIGRWWFVQALPYLHYNRALELHARGRSAAARAAAAVAVALEPRHVLFRLLLARSYRAVGAIDDALEALAAVDLGAENAEANRLFAELIEEKRATRTAPAARAPETSAPVDAPLQSNT